MGIKFRIWKKKPLDGDFCNPFLASGISQSFFVAGIFLTQSAHWVSSCEEPILIAPVPLTALLVGLRADL